jgi:putative OPT family oligopeptide transporter
MAGDTSQDLKTGFLLGATPKKQQYGELLGAVVSAIAIGATMHLLNGAWGFGSEELSAPQATMMKMVIEGVMGGDMPWSLVFVGVAIAVFVEIVGLPVLPVAIGIYLPIHLNAGVMLGGLVRLLVEKRKYASEAEKESCIQSGILYASGLIAGEGVVGILLAVFAVLGISLDISAVINLGNIGGLVAFALVLGSILFFCNKGKQSSK